MKRLKFFFEGRERFGGWVEGWWQTVSRSWTCHSKMHCLQWMRDKLVVLKVDELPCYGLQCLFVFFLLLIWFFVCGWISSTKYISRNRLRSKTRTEWCSRDCTLQSETLNLLDTSPLSLRSVTLLHLHHCAVKALSQFIVTVLSIRGLPIFSKNPGKMDFRVTLEKAKCRRRVVAIILSGKIDTSPLISNIIILFFCENFSLQA